MKPKSQEHSRRAKRKAGLRWLLRGGPIMSLATPLLILFGAEQSQAHAQSSTQSQQSPKSETTRRHKAIQSEGKKQPVHRVNYINGLTVEENNDGSTTLRIRGTARPTFNVMRLENPRRLVVELSQSRRGEVVPRVAIDNWSVTQVTIDRAPGGDETTRVVIDLPRESSYVALPHQNDLVVTVTPREAPPVSTDAEAETGKQASEGSSKARGKGNAEGKAKAGWQRGSQALRVSESSKPSTKQVPKTAGSQEPSGSSLAQIYEEKKQAYLDLGGDVSKSQIETLRKQIREDEARAMVLGHEAERLRKQGEDEALAGEKAEQHQRLESEIASKQERLLELERQYMALGQLKAKDRRWRKTRRIARVELQKAREAFLKDQRRKQTRSTSTPASDEPTKSEAPTSTARRSKPKQKAASGEQTQSSANSSRMHAVTGSTVLKNVSGSVNESPEENRQSAPSSEPKPSQFQQLPSSRVAAMSNSIGGGKKRRWRGQRITIELQESPIKDVLLLFSDIGKVNIIAGGDVQGEVTLRLTSVPWDQALDIILRSLNLGMVQEGNVIRVATANALEEERRKAIEEAANEVQLRPLQTRLVRLSYATVDEMLPKVQGVLSSRGAVTPDTRTNTLIVMDVAENIALAESLVAQLDAQTPQVLIEARIVEARTSWLRQLGIQWGFDFVQSPGTGNPTGLLFPNSWAVGGGSGSEQSNTGGILLPGSAANPNYAIDLPAPVGTGAGGALGMSFGSLAGSLNTNLRLSAAEDEGEVRIISAPSVSTMDNSEAQIEQGIQIPISQVSAQGVNTRYVNATLALRVTPHVTNEGSIVLEVQVQKNEADFINTGARGDPTILTKQAQSQMLILDGDTAVIGGIYTRNQSVNRKKIPWISEIPIIGWFFKNKSEADTRTEVLIFLTPKIVNRTTSIGSE